VLVPTITLYFDLDEHMDDLVAVGLWNHWNFVFSDILLLDLYVIGSFIQNFERLLPEYDLRTKRP